MTWVPGVNDLGIGVVIMAETYAGRLARVYAELGRRELSALSAENFSRESAATAVRERAEDASLPESLR